MYRLAFFLGADLVAVFRQFRNGEETAFLETLFCSDKMLDFDQLDESVVKVTVEVIKPPRADYCGLWMTNIYAPCDPRPPQKRAIQLELRADGQLLDTLMLDGFPDSGAVECFAPYRPNDGWACRRYFRERPSKRS